MDATASTSSTTGRGRCCKCCLIKGVSRSRRADGLICRACYRKLYAPREACGRCHDVKVVNARRDDVPYCENCYKQLFRKAACADCGELRTMHGRNPRKKRVCLQCWNEKYAPRPECHECGKNEVVTWRSERGQPYCRKCYVQHVRDWEECVDCECVTLPATRTEEGPLCGHCSFARRPPQRCDKCKEVRPVLHGRNGDVCPPCYREHFRPRYVCGQCGETDHAALWLDDRTPICKTCWEKLRQVS